MKTNKLKAKSFLKLLEFQESWNLIGQTKLGMPDHNQAETLNQFVSSWNV